MFKAYVSLYVFVLMNTVRKNGVEYIQIYL